MKRNYIQFLEDMVSSIRKIEIYTITYGISDLRNEGIYYDAALRNLEIIGEASKNIPDLIKEKYSDISWKELYGLRNIISHAYFGIDISEIEYIIEYDLADLKIKLERILNQIDK
ncbi:DUF86 domain-containing protein [Pedobacter sp. SD-b]|uniref:DUF86 domain-containing protein n=1 Tax=Pedobacter segetis TaxID=2793069 RepID=A0ABS1BMJ4_9SPHI|nr:HepT-like ribonuclease domain-containing protein [Pedobacter segetis]MBK0383997.1 DUF86 domain-containing protein [Pedobacter segetis]